MWKMSKCMCKYTVILYVLLLQSVLENYCFLTFKVQYSYSLQCLNPTIQCTNDLAQIYAHIVVWYFSLLRHKLLLNK